MEKKLTPGTTPLIFETFSKRGYFALPECPGPWLSEQFERMSREVNAALAKKV